jgi:hypothetical protein
MIADVGMEISDLKRCYAHTIVADSELPRKMHFLAVHVAGIEVRDEWTCEICLGAAHAAKVALDVPAKVAPFLFSSGPTTSILVDGSPGGPE